MTGSVGLDPLRGYRMLAASGLLGRELIDSVNAAALLQQLYDRLPDEATALARLPPERIDQLVGLVQLLCTLAPPAAVANFATRLTAVAQGIRTRSEWFLRHCGSCFAPQLLANADSILSGALANNDDQSHFLRLLTVLVRLHGSTSSTAATKKESSEPLERFIAINWESIAGSLDSRTDVLRTVFVVQLLGRMIGQEASVLQPVVLGWFCRLLCHPTADFKVKAKAFRLLGIMVAAAGRQATRGRTDKKDEQEERNDLRFVYVTVFIVYYILL